MNIPLELKTMKNFILWKLEKRNNKNTKTPYQTNGKMAKVNDSNTWDTYENVIKVKGFSGVGFVFSLDNDLIGIDFDYCIIDKIVNEDVLYWIKKIDSYTEISQSKSGIHILTKINKSELQQYIKEIYGNETGIKREKGEVYFTGRYFVLTGDIYDNMSELKYTKLSYIKNLLKYLTEDKKPIIENRQISVNNVVNFLTDNDIITLAEKHNNNFSYLYNEPGKKGNSEGDQSLINILCFYTKNADQIKRIMLNSSRFREKFNKHPTYLDNSIKKGLKLVNNQYDPNFRKNDKKNNQQNNNNQQDNNKDFEKIKWNKYFTNVTFKNENDKKMTITLNEYFNKYLDAIEKPEIDKMYVLPIKENVKCLLNHYNIKIKLNIIKGTYDVFVNNKQIKDNLEDYSTEILDKCIKHNFKIPKDRLMDILLKIAKDCEYNPVVNYLKESYKYYLKNPDNNIFKKLSKTIKSDSDFKDKFIGKFLLQMIHLASSKDDTQVAADYILVLQGDQYLGKTTWLKNLLPEKFRSKYFLGGKSIDPSIKDDKIETVTNWLVEMGEISSTFRKSDQEILKNFITDFKDKYRLPYAKEAIEKKRRVTLCGTTNDFEYLKDLTGSRRFLTLPCKWIDKKNSIDVNMLWGYIYSLYVKGASPKFSDEEIGEIMRYNDQFLNKPEKLLIIEDVWDLNPTDEVGEWKTSLDIFKELPPQGLLNKFTIARELKKTKIRFKRDKVLNKDIFFVHKKGNIIPIKKYENEKFNF